METRIGGLSRSRRLSVRAPDRVIGQQEGPALGKPQPSRPFLEYRSYTRFFTYITSLNAYEIVHT